MPYTYSIPTSRAFTDKGLSGYIFGPLNQKDLEIYYIESRTGHDTFIISRKIARTYYVLSGTGHFIIDDVRYPVEPGVLVEIPAKVEFSYTGKMTLLCVSVPRWFSGNDQITKWNREVIDSDSPCLPDGLSLYRGLVRFHIFGKSPVNAFLKLSQRLWDKIPARILCFSPIRTYGQVIHKLVCARDGRERSSGTVFLGNRAKLELIGQIAERKATGETLRVTVLGCGTGAEVYSIAWKIRSARPDLRLILHATDGSGPAVEWAKRGTYSRKASDVNCGAIIERMTEAEIEQFFEKEGESVRVKSWIRGGIDWQVVDPCGLEALELLGLQDFVVASNFLGCMDTHEAERSLRNIARLIRPEGYLFVEDIDLDVRTRVANDLGWKPVQELLEEAYVGDPGLRTGWPWGCSSWEPLNKRRQDWQIRYATAFQLDSNIEGDRRRSKSADQASDNERLQSPS
jgi:SAM-dependent methyltransferase